MATPQIGIIISTAWLITFLLTVLQQKVFWSSSDAFFNSSPPANPLLLQSLALFYSHLLPLLKDNTAKYFSTSAFLTSSSIGFHNRCQVQCLVIISFKKETVKNTYDRTTLQHDPKQWVPHCFHHTGRAVVVRVLTDRRWEKEGEKCYTPASNLLLLSSLDI